MAAESTGHGQQSFGSLAHSQAASADTQHAQESSKQANIDQEASVAMQLAAPTAYMLPVELLLEIFAELNTADMEAVTQVCRTWRAVANGDARLWRKIGFSVAFGARARDDSISAQAQLRAAVKRAEQKVVSVDVSNLPCHTIVTLCRILYSTTRTLRHILWSASSPLSKAAEDVYELALRCPRLQTLELRCAHRWSLFEKFTQEECNGLRLDSFSFSAPMLLDAHRWSYPPMIYDNARVVAVAVEIVDSFDYWTLGVADLLSTNSALERLTLQGISREAQLWLGRCFEMPALKYLDIRERDFADVDDRDDSQSADGPLPDPEDSEPAIDAPQLRELVADARLVCRLTPDTIDSLESLVLHIGACRYWRPEREWSALETIKDHQEDLRLVVAARGAFEALAFLSSDFFWPQLTEIDIELGESSAGTLVRLIAARQAGARGASKEQYMSLLQEAPFQRMTGTSFDNRQRRLTSSLGLTPKKVDSTDLTSVTSRIQIDTTNPPLCSDVTWKIKAPAKVPVGVLNWLRAQSNVELTVAN